MASDPTGAYIQDQFARIRRMQEESWCFCDKQHALAMASTRDMQKLDKLFGFVQPLMTFAAGAGTAVLAIALMSWAEKACRWENTNTEALKAIYNNRVE